MKIGRNDLCQCGSGKKYKKCHGFTVVSQVRIQAPASVRSQHFVPRAYVEARENLSRERHSFFAAGLVSADQMFEHGKAIQAQLADLLKDHSPIYWLAIQRRKPLSFVDHPNSPHELLIRWQLSSMFWIYGDHRRIDYRITSSGKITVERDKEAEARFEGEIKALACEIVNVPSAYRRLSKGASFHLAPDGALITRLPENLEEAAKLYDRRRSNSGEPLDERGMGIPIEKSRGTWSAGSTVLKDGSPQDTCGLRLRFYEENSIGGVSYSVGGFDGFEEPNFMRSAWELSDWLGYIQCFAPELKEKHDLDIEDFAACLRALDTLVGMNLKGQIGVTAHELGLLPLSPNNFEESMLSSLEGSCGAGRALEVLTKCSTLLEHEPLTTDDYDFFTWHSAGVLLKHGDWVFVDVSQISHKVVQVLMRLNINEQYDKGPAFERVVSACIRKRLGDTVSFPIPDSQELFANDSFGPFAEADVYVAKGEFLFLVECKACGVTERYLKGDVLHARWRWSKIRKWLNKSDKRARRIANEPAGANYSLDKSLKYLVPVVCSSMPEYFWDSGEDLFLDASTPRVCTVTELCEVIDRAEDLGLQDKPYAVPIRRR